jgi:GTP diphosphokinase / guanosine-3',5'-bis(diphosphate) 3'-diphosphatase
MATHKTRTGLELILHALEFSAHKHRDQRRKDLHASPYINHPIQLANLLVNVAGIDDPDVICAAILHDTIEDTETTPSELAHEFGARIRDVVMEVTDDKTLPKVDCKRLQIEHASHASRQAKLVKLADKICNLRDIASSPPAKWTLERQQDYFDWAKAVIDQVRGTNADLETAFDRAYATRPVRRL